MNIYKLYYTKKILVYVSVWFFLMIGQYYQAFADEPSGQTIRIISEEEMPVFLDLIGNRIRDNYERIITWSGEIDVKINMLHTGDNTENIFKNLTLGTGETPEAILQKAEEKTVFLIDANKNFVYIDNFREKPCKFLNHTTGKDLGSRTSGPHSSGPYWSTLIVRLDFSLEAKPKSFDIIDNKIIQRKVVKKTSPRKESRTGLYNRVDDPRKIFMPGAISTWELHNILTRKIERFGKIEFDGYKFQMEEHQKGDITEYKIILPGVVSMERSSPEDYSIETKVFSDQYGFNLIDYQITNGSGKLLQQFTYEYELINGVYLPKRVLRKDYRSNGEVGIEKDCAYTNSKLNQKIPAEKFEYTNLKLKDGDIFIDEILKKEYRYKADTRTLQPVVK